jgi:hypothetical protein
MFDAMTVSNQWAARPADERYTSLTEMHAHFKNVHENSREVTIDPKSLTVVPAKDNRGLTVEGPSKVGYAPTNWAFNQLVRTAQIPGLQPNGLRLLPSPLAADCLNYGLQIRRRQLGLQEDCKLLLHRNSGNHLNAVTSAGYGRIWNDEITQALFDLPENWQIPGEFGKKVPVTKENTTLYASDRDMFVFLCDEQNRIDIPNRRDGKTGTLGRGLMVSQSEVGKQSLRVGTVYFDFLCMNRIIWGGVDFQEIKVRHTSGAPTRWLDEIMPAINRFAQGSSKNIIEAIAEARQQNVADKLDEFLATRFGKGKVESLKATHMAEENRPIETVWDVVTAATAYAKTIPWQDERVDFERTAGLLLPRFKERVAA